VFAQKQNSRTETSVRLLAATIFDLQRPVSDNRQEGNAVRLRFD
jgi:hypothetical protein